MLLLALVVAAAVQTPPAIAPGCAIAHMCTDGPPETEWDEPSCEDFDSDTTLMENAERGDRSSLEMLRQRFVTARTYAERYRVARFLLGRVADDRPIWNALYEHAQNYVDFAGDRDKLFSYCDEHDFNPYEYELMSLRALDAISADRRARPLLLRAARSSDDARLHAGIAGLALQHDDALLPAIDEALNRCGTCALLLAWSRSEAADAVARKHLSEKQLGDYERLRHLADVVPRP
jgi:hypothetical protein